MKSLKSAIKYCAGSAVRWAERILPVNGLVVLLLPIAIARAIYEWLHRSYFSRMSRKRKALLAAIHNHQPRRYPPGKFWGGHVSLCMARFFRLWPDRLHQPRWIKRCTFNGKERLDDALATNRPVVLASVHFANVTEIYHWLRANRYEIALLRHVVEGRDTAYRDYIDTLADRANGLENIPRVFRQEEMLKVRSFLKAPRRILAVALDARHPHASLARGEVFGMRFMTGALRLAAVTNAIVIPCIIRASWCLRSEIVFGERVPDLLVTDRCYDRAMEHVLREISPWIIANPEQCAPYLLAAIELEQYKAAPDGLISAGSTPGPLRQNLEHSEIVTPSSNDEL